MKKPTRAAKSGTRSSSETPVQKNLKAARGIAPKGDRNLHVPGNADEIPGQNTARGQYGLPEEDMDAEDFYAASNSLPEDPEVSNLK